MNDVSHFPYVSADIPGIGGVIKESPEDFIVEEIPSYVPCGYGEHCYLTIEKRDLTTLEAIRRLARDLKIQERDIGYAGMKDAVGVTRQTLSIQWLDPEKARALNIDGVTVLAAERHTNKLKIGHLKGNSFRVVIRGVSTDAAEILPTVLDRVSRRGMPNYFGFQRYGVQGNSHQIGSAMLRGEWRECVDCLIGNSEMVHDTQWSAAIDAYRRGDVDKALRQFPRHCRSERDVLQRLVSRPDDYEKAFSAVHPRLKKLYLSAAQSYLFDQVVARRIEQIDTLMAGDLAIKHVNGACFLVEDEVLEQGRADVFEISASGPMFGCRMKQSEGAVWQCESEILELSGLKLNMFDLPGGLRMEGERRPLRVPAGGLSWSVSGDSATLEFSLPKGSYATSLIREVTKSF